MKLMLIGYARHGKDTVAEILQREFGLRFTSSSWFCAEKLMFPYYAAKGTSYASVQECFDDRSNHRAEWFDVIGAYNDEVPSRLTKEILEVNDIYVGIRKGDELLRARADGLFDYAIWVDRSQFIAPEPESSNTLDFTMADYIIDNNGTLADLEENTVSLYKLLLTLKAQ